jgi:hypothetical protein
MDIDWAMWIRFSKEPRFNTSQTFPDIDPDKWGTDEEEREIWFFVPKRKYLPPFVLTRYIPWVQDTTLGTTGFPLDSARVPSVIYHEWTHLMTRPYLGIMKENILAEAYSDYFGSVIEGRPRMGDTKEFSTGPYIQNFDKQIEPVTEIVFKMPGEYIPTFFWILRKAYGAQRADTLIWKALKFLDPQSGVKDLPAAVARGAEGILSPTELEGLKAMMDYLFTLKPKGRRGD